MLRTGETAAALVTSLAAVLAMSPAVTRTPQAVRKTADDLAKKLRRQISSAEKCEGLQVFMRRTFSGNGPEGHA